MTTTPLTDDLDRLRFENAQLAATVRSLELQLFALYAERDTDREGRLETSYQHNLKLETSD